ncbi:MAG: HAMP domain-containing sensor histidine kinase [Patescibacteria group bacterium]
MLRIFFQTALIFLEIMLALVGATGISYLLSQFFYVRKASRHVLGSLVLASAGTGQLVVLLGQIVTAKGDPKFGDILVSLQWPLILVGSLSMILFVVAAYAKSRKRFWNLLAILFILPFAALFLNYEFGISQAVYGAQFPSSSARELLTYLLPLNIAYALLAWSAFSAHRTSRRPADRYLMMSGLCGILMSICGMVTNAIAFAPGAPLMLLILLMQEVLFSIGALAKDNQDREVERKPLIFLQRSLLFQITVTSALSFLVFTLALAAVNTSYFSQDNLASEISETRNILEHDLDSYRQRQADVQLDAMFLASYLDDSYDADDIESLVREWSDSRQNNLVSVTDSLGQSVWSNYSEYDLSVLSELTVQAKADFNFAAQADAAETDEILVAPHILSAENLSKAGGRGVVTITRPLMPNDLLVERNTSSVARSGLIDAKGRIMAANGAPPSDEIIRKIIDTAANSDGPIINRSKELIMFGVANLSSSSGADNLSAYRFITQEDWDTRIFSGLINVAAVSVMLGFLISMLFFFLVHLKLNPIAELQYAARKVSDGDYHAIISYDGPDELGQMAQAFNNMSDSLRQRTDYLKEKVREQRDFINYIAHELKSPAGAVRWALEMLIDSNSKSTKSQRREMLDHALNVNENMRNLISELLDFSRMERGAIELTREALDVEELIRAVLDGHRLEFGKDNFTAEIKLPSRGVSAVFGDRKRLSQVIENIVGNAYKYGLSGKKIDVTLSLSTMSGPNNRRGRFVRVTVRDYGIGIPHQQQKEIFKRFFRADNAVDSGVEGTGLGLHITKRLIDMHGGEIWFSSHAGKGTTFKFTVPVYEQKS